ncbi:MAG: DUF3857 and transglutaminase domain-containing protein [Myxococcales bacterium]|nr:DUF3857 and transglutaminase domain-containing protein [Myxococcales bacterium]
MKRLTSAALSVLILLLLSGPAAAWTTLVLSDGRTVTLDQPPFFDGGAFRLPAGARLPRERVAEIRFEKEVQATPDTWRYDAARYEALFAKGRELARQYPNRDGVILEDLGAWRLEDDGTQRYSYRFAALILKDGAKRWGQVGVGVDPDRNRLDGPFGVVVHPDGSYRVAGDSARSSVSPYQGDVFFNRYNVTRLAIPDVRVGDIVEYQYTLTDFRPPRPDFFFPQFVFQTTVPLARSRMEVRVPAGRQLNWRIKNFPAGRAEPERARDADGGDLYHWELTDVAPFDAEPFMPNFGEIAPSLRATTLTDWGPIFDYLTEFYRSRLVVTPPVEAAVAAAVGDAKTLPEKIDRLYRFVQRRIRYISIKTDIGTGYTGHAAEVTLANGYGDCTDKALLLATMLRVIGVESHPIALHTFGGRRDLYDLPNLGGNHAINVLFLDGKKVFLDATAETFRYPDFRPDDYGRPYLDALGREIGTITPPPAGADRFRQEWTLRFDETGGARGTRVSLPTGALEAMNRGRLEGLDPKQRRQELRAQALQFGSGGQLIDFRDDHVDDLDKPLRTEVEFQARSLAKTVGGVWVIDLPLPERFSAINLETRATDLLTPFVYTEDYEFRVVLPPRWEAVDLPPPLAASDAYTDFSGRYEKTPDGFILHCTLTRKSAAVPAADYETYRETLIRVETFFGRRVFAREVQP